uniref:Uncharacterized protein n=1 Tax=Bacillus phage Jabberwock TaxID=3163548 RepID=A0AAU8EIK8_9CAUD
MLTFRKHTCYNKGNLIRELVHMKAIDKSLACINLNAVERRLKDLISIVENGGTISTDLTLQYMLEDVLKVKRVLEEE